MNTQVFVPVTDEMIYNHPEKIEGPLIPYYVGMECENWLSIEINPDESTPISKAVKKQSSRTMNNSGLRLAYSA